MKRVLAWDAWHRGWCGFVSVDESAVGTKDMDTWNVYWH